jgi:ABC-2 type transport system permease protein
MSTVISLYIASLREFVRNRLTIFWTLAFPVLFIVLFGLIFGGSSSTTFNVGLVDQDNTQASQGLVQGIKKVTALKIQTGDLSTERSKLNKGDVDFVLIIPQGYQANLGKQTTNIQMLYDSSRNQTTSQIELSAMQGMIQDINENISNQTEHIVPPLALKAKTVQTKPIGYIDILVPGILAMALMQLGLFGTAMPIVQLRQQQVLRRLSATPLPRWQVMASQIMLRLTIGLVQTGVIVAIGAWAFHVTIANPLALVGVVLLGAASFIGIGFLIASISSNADAANGITSVLNFPMMFLSGIFFPLAFLPDFLRPIIYAIPVTYLADILRQVMVGSTPQFPILTDVAVLAAWLVGAGLLSVRLFKWE